MRAPVAEQINLGQPVLFSFDWVPMQAGFQARAVNLVVSDSPDFTTNVRVFENIRQDQFAVACDRGKTYWWRYIQIVYFNRVVNFTPPPITLPWSPVWAFRTSALVLPNPVTPPPPVLVPPDPTPTPGPAPKQPPAITDSETTPAPPVKAGLDTNMILILGAAALAYYVFRN